MSYYKFKNDLSFGHNYEDKLLTYLNFHSYERAPNKQFKDWDLKVILRNGDGSFNEKKPIYYEVKACRLAQKTGNICIEFQCGDKPSGITTSKADYYAYFVLNDGDEPTLYLIPTSFIRSLINNLHYKKVMNGGDGWRSKFYLFNKELFKDYIYLQERDYNDNSKCCC